MIVLTVIMVMMKTMIIVPNPKRLCPTASPGSRQNQQLVAARVGLKIGYLEIHYRINQSNNLGLIIIIMSFSIQWRFWRYSYTVCRYAPFSGNPVCCYIQSFQQGCHVLRIGTTCLMTTRRNLWAHHRICIASRRRPTQTFVTCWGDISTV